MVANPDCVWLGVEYFCYETDELWKKTDEQMAVLAKEELDHIGRCPRGRLQSIRQTRTAEFW